MKNNKGVVLILALWVLLILSLIAWGLGRRSALEVSLLETYRGKLRSYAAARAGINTILDLLQRTPSPKDTLYTTGINIDQTKSPEDIFSHINTGQNAYAIVQWPAQNFNLGDNNPHLEYGLRDEGGRININAIGVTNYQILSALLQLYGLSQPDGDKLALAIINYTGINAQVNGNNSFMNMNDSLLKPKNRPYENILELLQVNGMTRQIFDKLKDDVTVYGNPQSGLWVNTDTANNDVIQAVAYAASRLNPSIIPATVIAQAYAVRDGADGQSFTADDGAVPIASVTTPSWPAALQEGVSNYYRARVIGVDADSGTRTVIEAVIQQTQGAPGKIIYWQKD
jgi:type II secretory pathway component PulK